MPDIVSILRSSPTPLSIKDLADRLKIKGDARRDLHDLVRELETEGLITRIKGQVYTTPDKDIPQKAEKIIGSIERKRNNFILKPADRRAKDVFDITDINGALQDDIVIAEVVNKKARVKEILGNRTDPKIISLIAALDAGIRQFFPDKVIQETGGMVVPDLENRTDLRDIPLITIDGEDARDFDDAVFAESDGDGFHLIVAIADVSYYVRPETALGREAYIRGNSTYFPDRVYPMLPEKLSNDLCSLRPDEDRATLAVHLWIDAHGNLTRYEFVRGLMRSRARMTYEFVQENQNHPLVKTLYDAFRVLDAARIKRGALDLDIPERKIQLNEKGNMVGVSVRARYDSHKLIEEFMILANVAAASFLSEKRASCLYRVHDRPSEEKLAAVHDFLKSFDVNVPKTGIVNAEQINHVIRKVADHPYKHLVHNMLLRMQMQANYSPENIGHFGLSLNKYAHFTSPIRRYADLIVHRSIIREMKFGKDGLSDKEKLDLFEIAEHISATERTSSDAERNAVDRFCAAYLSDRIGAQMGGKISGVTRFGLFVTLDSSAADGFVPIRTLPQDFYDHDEASFSLKGKRTGITFRLGDPVRIMVLEADPITGSSLFSLVGNLFQIKKPCIKRISFVEIKGEQNLKK